jgi:hypothetical protein
MSTNRGSEGGRTDRTQTARGPGAESPEPAPVLSSTVVCYRGRPDRRTVYPPGLSSVARMSTWLTADDDAFVDLADAR